MMTNNGMYIFHHLFTLENISKLAPNHLSLLHLKLLKFLLSCYLFSLNINNIQQFSRNISEIQPNVVSREQSQC